VLGTGDSDFTPLVHKLRELNRRVIGIGIEASTSALLPPACDEFLFYDRLEGVEPRTPRKASARAASNRRGGAAKAPAAVKQDVVEPITPAPADEPDLGVLLTQTLSGLERSSSGPVLGSMLKRAMLRKDPTFNEANYGFRGFGELLRNLADHGVVELSEGSAKGDPEVSFPAKADDEQAAFSLLRDVVERVTAKSGPPHLSGLKNQLRKQDSDFSEKKFGYGGFLQFAKAGRARGAIDMEWDEDADDYVVRPASSG
jgi:hypothetical protein